ncbi:MAG: hypothetical protein ABIS18_01725 [Actinomycetota bacterium]
MNCPKCNSLNSDDAQWCSLCLTRFEPEESEESDVVFPQILADDPQDVQEAWAVVAEDPSKVMGQSEHVEVASGPVRKRGETLTWACSSCQTENSMDVQMCRVCGTSFFSAFMTHDEAPSASPSRNPMTAGFLSLFPGVGHFYLGLTAEGISRMFLGLWWVGSAVMLPAGPSVMLGVKIIYILASLGLISVSIFDAYRYAETPGTPPVLSARLLLYTSLALLGVLMMGGIMVSISAR